MLASGPTVTFLEPTAQPAATILELQSESDDRGKDGGEEEKTVGNQADLSACHNKSHSQGPSPLRRKQTERPKVRSEVCIGVPGATKTSSASCPSEAGKRCS